jgi:type I restriction enzyme S subunit
MIQLPPGWALSSVRRLGLWAGGSTPSKSNPEFWEEGTIPWISPKDMKATHLESSQDHVTQAAVDLTNLRLIPANSVAVVVRSGILERTIPVARIPFPATLNQDMKAVSPHPGLDARWVLYALMSQERDILEKCRKSGTTVASLETNALMAMPMLVPPTAEQVRIVTAIEEAFSLLDAGEAGLHATRTRLKRMRDSVLAAAVTGHLVPQDPTDTPAGALLAARGVAPLAAAGDSPVGWASTTIGSMFKVGVGTTPSRKDPSLWNGDVPWVSSGEVAFNRIKTTRETITARAVEGKPGRVLPAGTVMLAMIGEGKTRGQAAILDIAAAHNQNCASIDVASSRVLSEWVYIVLRERYLRTRQSGSGNNQPALNKRLVEAIELPLPPPEEQARIVAEVERQFSFIEACEGTVDTAIARSAGLRRSVLKAAFEGRLVPQDPSDEPASVLLERIAPERAAPKSARRGQAKVEAS